MDSNSQLTMMKPARTRITHTGIRRLAVAVPLALALSLPIAIAMTVVQTTAGQLGEAEAQEVQKTAGRVLVDRVVAVVNDSIILHSEMMRRVVPLAAELSDISDARERNRRLGKLKEQVLDDMISEDLIVQAATESRLDVNSKEVEAALADIKKQNKLDDTKFAEALRLQGYSMSGYRRDVRRQLLRFRAVNTIVRPRVTITDEELKAKYEELKGRSAAVKRVKLSHVLIALPKNPTAQQIAEAKGKASAVLQRARAGEDFATLAKRFSDDEATKASGGDFGWIARNSLSAEWEAIAFAMAKGEIRGPINGPRGLSIFRVDDLEKNDDKSFEDMKDQIRGQLLRQGMDRETRQWMEELRKKAFVQKKL